MCTVLRRTQDTAHKRRFAPSLIAAQRKATSGSVYSAQGARQTSPPAASGRGGDRLAGHSAGPEAASP
jgi:hypothetical protein